LPVDDPRRRCPSIALAERALGWKPRVGLEEGLEATIEYFRAVLRPQAAREAAV
jgi:nucleoside-diphosphate-sugar epimerase